MNTLANASYHSFNFAAIGCVRNLRATSMKEVKSDGLKFFEIEFSDDFPLSGNEYIEPFSSTQNQYLYSLDSVPLDYYGVALLDGSNDEIIKIPAVKENLEINTSAINGSIYDDTALKFKEKDVRLNCLLLAEDIVEFWRNYNALLYDLSKPDYRNFEYNSVVYECFYKSSSVKRFSNVNKIWCEFELNLVFVRHENI